MLFNRENSHVESLLLLICCDLDKKKEGGKEKEEKKKRFCKRVRNLKSKRRRATRLSSRLETLTFVSRAEVHCYENQLSVKRRMERWNVTNITLWTYVFFLPMKSGRSPKWQVAAPASGSEIRDATTSGLKRKAKKLLESSTLQDGGSILGGNIRPLVTHSPRPRTMKVLLVILPVEKEDSWWESLSLNLVE